MARHKGKVVVKYAAAKRNTEKGRELAKKQTQAAAVYAACRKPRTFAGILAAVGPKLRGKKAKTVLDNTRWYVSRLKRDGFLRRVEERGKKGAGPKLPPGARVTGGHLILSREQARAERQPVRA